MSSNMTVKELIKFLQQQPQDLQVAFQIYRECVFPYSEQALLETDDIKIKELGKSRADGWVPDKRPGEETEMYLVFPGN